MCSSAVKSKALKSVYALLLLVAACAAEELLPDFLRVGFPVLLSLALVYARKRTLAATILFAVAAGAMEESISALPVFTSAGYFLLASLLTRFIALDLLSALLTFPFYQLYLVIWSEADGWSFCLPALLALPLGALTYYAVLSLMTFLDKWSAVDELE